LDKKKNTRVMLTSASRALVKEPKEKTFILKISLSTLLKS
jgi:hypothetical protein